MTDQTETLDTFLDLEPVRDLRAGKGYLVVHPLNDAPEVKRGAGQVAPIRLTPACRVALVAVRCYLAAIMLMGGYRVLTLLRR
jgi:hypothetical protein